MGVETYRTTADANTALMPEGQDPGTVNNGVRQFQADVALWYQDQGWFRPGAPARTCTYLATNSFRDPGVNSLAYHLEGRRVRASGLSTGTIYGSITSASFTGGNTDVTVNWDGSGLSNEVLDVALGVAPTGATTWIPAAGEAHRGLIELATAAEVLAGVDALRAVTPASIAGGAVKANPGYLMLPGGLLVQFGFVETVDGGIATVPYTVPHTTVVLFIGLTTISLENYMMRIHTSKEEYFIAQMFTLAGGPAPVGVRFFWMSIGY